MDTSLIFQAGNWGSIPCLSPSIFDHSSFNIVIIFNNESAEIKTKSSDYNFEIEHSVEEVLERPTGYPKVGGSKHGSGDFSLQPQRNPYLS